MCLFYFLKKRNWKTGNRLLNMPLKSSLGQPEQIYFCPTNWRRIMVAYKSEINVWNLDQFDVDRMKCKNHRLILPITDDSVEEEQVAPEIKDEFETNNLAITGLDETYKDLIEEVLDKRARHILVYSNWLNDDDILVSTHENYIFKVKFDKRKKNKIQILILVK